MAISHHGDEEERCSSQVGEGAYFMAGLMLINGLMLTVLALSGIFHSALRRLGQPSIISHILVRMRLNSFFIHSIQYMGNSVKKLKMQAGVVVGPTFLGRAVDLRRLGMEDAGRALGDTIYYLRIVFMFFVGLEMDLRYLRHNLRRSLVLACGGSAVCLLLAFLAGPFFFGLLHPGEGPFHPAKLYASTTLLMLVLSSTASPVLIRIVTELKLTASETGQLAIGAAFATDIASLTAISMMVVNPTSFDRDTGKPLPPRIPNADAPSVQLVVFVWLALVVWAAAALAVRAARLLNRVRRGHRYISMYELCGMLLLIVSLSLSAQHLGYSASMAAYIIGLAMPRDGPMARTLVDRLTYPVHQLIMPLCFGAIGARLDFAQIGRFTASQLTAAVTFATLLSVAGKVAGTVLACRMLGSISAQEALVLGFLLNVKGYSDILAINFGDKSGVWGETAQVVLLLSSIVNTFMAGPASAAIVRQQRRAFTYRSHCLQDLRLDHELRVLVCVHGAAGVHAMLTLAELSKGSAPIAVYLLHLIELKTKSKYAITHLYRDPLDAVDKKKDDDDQWGYSREMDQVTAAVHAFTNDTAVPVRQMTAISNLLSMDADVRNAMEDARASLLIVPFHKDRRYDGRMVCRREGRRQLNQRIMHKAPCTVGVLVDRNLPSISGDEANDEDESPLLEQCAFTVAAVFLGGPDDREAVAYATRLAAHPAVSVTVSRFLLPAAEPEPDRRSSFVSAVEEVVLEEVEEEEEESVAADREFMEEMYTRFVEPGHVAYTERYVSNGVETLNSLSSMVGAYSLFVVGKGSGGGAAWTAMTAGMGGLEEEEECSELGPIGELLASDDLLAAGCSCSVLVLQQHTLHRKMKTWRRRHPHSILT